MSVMAVSPSSANLSRIAEDRVDLARVPGGPFVNEAERDRNVEGEPADEEQAKKAAKTSSILRLIRVSSAALPGFSTERTDG